MVEGFTPVDAMIVAEAWESVNTVTAVFKHHKKRHDVVRFFAGYPECLFGENMEIAGRRRVFVGAGANRKSADDGVADFDPHGLGR